MTMLMEGKIDQKNCIGRKILEYIDQLVKDVACGRYVERRTLAQNR